VEFIVKTDRMASSAKGTDSTDTDKMEEALESASVQLGSMDLAADAGADSANAGESDNKCCASCGTTDNGLKRCTACQSVWYCGVNCQIDHRKAHKKDCRRIKKDLEARQPKRGGREGEGSQAGGRKVKEEERFSLWNPKPREECPICMVVMPLSPDLQMYMACCGKTICYGCTFSQQLVTRKTNQERGDGEPMLEDTCPFCRKVCLTEKDEEKLAKGMKKRVESGDANAMFHMSAFFDRGSYGFPVDSEQSLELLKRAADLGHGEANWKIGMLTFDGESGFVKSKAKARMYCEKAAKEGHCQARYTLSVIEVENDNNSLAIRHIRVAAQSGHPRAIDWLTDFKEEGLISEEEIEEAKRDCDEAIEEMRTKERDRWIQYLKNMGEYDGSISRYYGLLNWADRDPTSNSWQNLREYGVRKQL